MLCNLTHSSSFLLVFKAISYTFSILSASLPLCKLLKYWSKANFDLFKCVRHNTDVYL